MNRLEIKALAKEQIRGNIGALFVVTLVVFVVMFALSFVAALVPIVGPIAYDIIVAPALSLSLIMVYVNLVKGKKPEAGDAFAGFYDCWSAFKVSFLTSLFITLWSFLFVIPGFIKMFSYSMSMYILAENKGMPALEAIRRSKEMMHGHKMDLFVLMLSFIGWILLVMVTFGIAAIWVVPYMETTMVNFYNKIKPQEAITVDFDALEEMPVTYDVAPEVAVEEVPVEEVVAEEVTVEEVVEETPTPEAEPETTEE